MLYYRVKPDADWRPKYGYDKSGKLKVTGNFVANELYTPGERKMIANSDRFFDQVNVSPKLTYWFFGARFEYGKGPNK